jgi:ATP-dependent Lhr-like helicase
MTEFTPLVSEWFSTRIGTPTEPQRLGWPLIRAGHDVLISAPTGSGKTLAAFLSCLDELIREANTGTLTDETRVLYVSPLKALSNDIHKNLEVPLSEMQAPIRTAVRTGDTPARERQQMGRKPPHVLVTTPESLFILLTAERPREMLRSVRTVIVDEIHAVADDKRGTHLAVSLARLEALARRRPQRIGLSATVKPIEEVAQFLSRDARIVDVGHRRAMDLAVEIPNDELGPIATNELWRETYDRIAALIQEHRTTLVFVNTRRLAERVSHALGERLGEATVLPHHGSLARPLRLDAEERLKYGRVRAVVATASLELGIDVGTVDLVCQVGSPRSIAVALQRVGRSGHWVGAQPKGRLFPTTRDELIECAALISAIGKGDLERIEIPRNALDILAQHIVSAAAAEPWKEDDLFGLIRSSYPYQDLTRADFDAVVSMLSDGISTSRGRAGAYLHRDQVNGRVRGRRNARLTAITSGGAIPETTQYAVVLEPEGKMIGTLDEDFAVESMSGDVFTLGTHSWRIRRVEMGRVRVEDAQGAPPSIPFWLGEAPGRSPELSAEVSLGRESILHDGRHVAMGEPALRQARAYLQAGVAILGELPTQQTVVAERFFDEAGGMQLVIHAPFGARINRAWGLALRKRFCRTFNFELQAAATDNGIVISLAEQHSFPLDLVFSFLRAANVEDVLRQALLASPMFGARWRWNASRALAVPRFRGGRRVPAPIQRIQSDDLLASVFPDQVACAENLTGPPEIPDHPLVRETMDNCLHEAMDVDGLRRVLAGIESGTIRTVAVETAEPSQVCHEILNSNPYAFLDDAPLEERRARAVQLRSTLRADVSEGTGILDPAAIAEVAAESWPVVRDADELHDALLTLTVLPPVEEWRPWFHELRGWGRASERERQGKPLWVATERAAVGGDALATARGWMESIGPVTGATLGERVALPPEEVEAALLKLEAEGQVLRGKFTPGTTETEWCNRRVLARIHRLTLGKLRREIEPVVAWDFYRFLVRWQHLTPGSQLHGADGTLQILRQLQGYEIPAAAWESEVLRRRVVRYEPELLDRLCLSGEIAWGRLSPRDREARAARPTRVAPIAFFRREDACWLLQTGPEPALSHHAQDVLRVLRGSGASFFADLVRLSGRLAAEVEDGLWELVSAGLVTADGFENLRALLDPKRRRGEGRGRTARPRHAPGRWALLQPVGEPVAAPVDAFAEQLLLRWGVVFRDLLARETVAPPWRELLLCMRRREAKGEIRGGRFVAGFVGEQFARPEALDLLRAVRRQTEEPPAVSHADPLNLAGIILPGPRVSPLTRAG